MLSKYVVNNFLFAAFFAKIIETPPPYSPTTPNTTFSFQQREKKFQVAPDGATRIIKVGKISINFKKTTPKNLLAKGEISSLVIQALREIGIDRINNDEELKTITLLKKENQSYLLHDIELAPVWIKKIMQKAL